MNYKKFSFYNVVGCIAWVFTMLFAGHFLQKWILSQFGFDLRLHLEVIVLGIVLVTTAPIIYKLIFHKGNTTSTAIHPELCKANQFLRAYSLCLCWLALLGFL
jgi:membrane-associated protein